MSENLTEERASSAGVPPNFTRALEAAGPVRRRWSRIPRRHLLLQILALIAVVWALVFFAKGAKTPAPAAPAEPFVVTIEGEAEPAAEPP